LGSFQGRRKPGRCLRSQWAHSLWSPGCRQQKVCASDSPDCRCVMKRVPVRVYDHPNWKNNSLLTPTTVSHGSSPHAVHDLLLATPMPSAAPTIVPSYASRFKHLALSFPSENVLHVELNRFVCFPISPFTHQNTVICPPSTDSSIDLHLGHPSTHSMKSE